MPPGRFRTAKSALDPRAKILLWALLISMICGVTQLGEPIDNLWRSGRDVARSHPAGKDIVVVAIDDRSLEQIDRWPWPRRHHALMIDQLRALGARRIVLDYDVSSGTNAEDDRRLLEALIRARGEVILPVRMVVDTMTGRRTDLVPAPMFRDHAVLAHVNAWHNMFGEVWELFGGLTIEGNTYRSVAATLANAPLRTGEMIPLDFSVDVRSIPLVSAADLLRGQVSRDRIAGKDVIVALASGQTGDMHLMPGRGVVPGVFFQVIGAHTLEKGSPVRWGWLPGLAAGLLLAAVYLFISRRRMARAALVAAVVLILTLPFLMDDLLVFADYVPGTMLLAIVVGAHAWARFRRRGVAINPLSGLANLNALRDEPSMPDTALVAGRIQNFAEIISTLPEEMERILIRQIANRIALGAGGSRIYQGDEGIFAWLVNKASTASLGDQLDALHALFRSPIVVGDRHVDLAVAFGVDVGSARSLGNRLGSALVASDEAMADGLRWKAYDPAKLEEAEWRLSLLGRLDAAIDNGEIWVAYQPKLDLRTRRICGAEALVRWSHPERGLIGPDDFIQAAEQHNRIEKLTVHVLNDAVRIAARVNARGIDFDIAVNLSARLLDHPNLVAIIRAILTEHALDPRHLTLEVTESAAMSSSGRSIGLLNEIRMLGVNLSIDDYGTGFSTLDYLKKIPATEIKIDRSFVAAMDKSQSDRLMVNSTIELAHSLGRTVVAEGVERQETLTMLAAMGCDRVQGYLIGRPMPFADFAAILSEEKGNKVA